MAKNLLCGVRTDFLHLTSIYVCCVPVWRVHVLSAAYITDFESCTGPISTNPASTVANDLGIARETCFVVSRLELA